MSDDNKAPIQACLLLSEKLLGGTKHKRPSRTMNPLRRHSKKIGNAYGKNAWFERRPRVRWSLPLGRDADQSPRFWKGLALRAPHEIGPTVDRWG
jgi:hypothetical protein